MYFISVLFIGIVVGFVFACVLVIAGEHNK